MITIRPFKAVRPAAQFAKMVASKPYDVLNSREAKVEAQGNPSSFLHVTKSEIDLPEGTSLYGKEVYAKAKENLNAFVSRNILFKENKPCYYVYRLAMPVHNGLADKVNVQTGLVCLSSLDDYENNLIKKHEFTRPEKEQDRITHIITTAAQTGNVFLAYKKEPSIDELIANWTKEKNAVYDFVAEDGIQHTIWIVNDEATIDKITELFRTKVSASYIADGHHRAASAAKARKQMTDIAGENADYFLTTLFPSDQLHIMDYNRLIKDLNGSNPQEILSKLEDKFVVKKSGKAISPQNLHEFGMYLDKKWHLLCAKANTFSTDPIGILDVTILQNNILEPIFGIKDQRTDARIDFVGGIRGLDELEKRVNSGEMAVAFSLHPVTIEQLFAIADDNKVMPPKSTWFEPKLRDGLLTHVLSD